MQVSSKLLNSPAKLFTQVSNAPSYIATFKETEMVVVRVHNIFWTLARTTGLLWTLASSAGWLLDYCIWENICGEFFSFEWEMAIHDKIFTVAFL